MQQDQLNQRQQQKRKKDLKDLIVHEMIKKLQISLRRLQAGNDTPKLIKSIGLHLDNLHKDKIISTPQRVKIIKKSSHYFCIPLFLLKKERKRNGL